VNIVDSSGWLEYFNDGPDAAFVAQVLQETETLIVSTTTVVEVFASVCRTHGEGAALQAAAAMQQGLVVSLDTAAALEAGRLAVTHRVSEAVGAVLAAAERHGAAVWTLDEKVRHVPGVRYRARTGQRVLDTPAGERPGY
jgi:predicted nucleic acid-binding protein